MNTLEQHNVPGLRESWLPFTANRQFKQDPIIFTSASGVHCIMRDGKEVLDAAAGLWCVNTGHCHPKIVEAIQMQAKKMCYALSFNGASDRALELADRLTQVTPEGIDRFFFANSGSEAVETGLKIALAYQRAIGEGQRRTLIGRIGGYHGVNFGGMSVGGMGSNRRVFPTLPDVGHLPFPYDASTDAFSVGQADVDGASRAAKLREVASLYGGDNIAAVIVEPVIGSGGVVPPPVGYLEALKAICEEIGALLIFDEVITGFGRCGYATFAERVSVTPDVMTFAKGLTAGHVPMGAAATTADIYDAVMSCGDPDVAELAHGYTYSGHPLASAAAIAAQDVYEQEDMYARARQLEPIFAKHVHALKDEDAVCDIRSIGLMAAVELSPESGLSTYDVYRRCLDHGVVVRNAGPNICLSPALCFTEGQVTTAIDAVRKAIQIT